MPCLTCAFRLAQNGSTQLGSFPYDVKIQVTIFRGSLLQVHVHSVLGIVTHRYTPLGFRATTSSRSIGRSQPLLQGWLIPSLTCKTSPQRLSRPAPVFEQGGCRYTEQKRLDACMAIRVMPSQYCMVKPAVEAQWLHRRRHFCSRCALLRNPRHGAHAFVDHQPSTASKALGCRLASAHASPSDGPGR